MTTLYGGTLLPEAIAVADRYYHNLQWPEAVKSENGCHDLWQRVTVPWVDLLLKQLPPEGGLSWPIMVVH